MTDPIRIPCHPAIGIHGWEFTITPEIQAQILAPALERIAALEHHTHLVCTGDRDDEDAWHQTNEPMTTHGGSAAGIDPCPPTPVAADKPAVAIPSDSMGAFMSQMYVAKGQTAVSVRDYRVERAECYVPDGYKAKDQPAGDDARLSEHKAKGLLPKYIITKSDGRPVDPEAEYFVLRLDLGGSDLKHIAACRMAALCYAKYIEGHLPLLAADLRRKCSTGMIGSAPEDVDRLIKRAVGASELVKLKNAICQSEAVKDTVWYTAHETVCDALLRLAMELDPDTPISDDMTKHADRVRDDAATCKQSLQVDQPAGDDAAVEALVRILRDLACMSTTLGIARGLLSALQAGEVPTICNLTTNEMTLQTEVADLRAKLAEADNARMAWRDKAAELERERDDARKTAVFALEDFKNTIMAERDKALALAEMRLAGYNDLEAAYNKSVGEHAKQRDAARAEADALKREVAALRQYGNKACTSMADEALAKGVDE